MALTKYASFDAEVLDVKGASSQQHTASLDKLSDFENYRTGDGYLYVRIRAISSRVNKNHDGWPSVELAGSRDIFDRHHSASGFTVEAADGNQEYGFATFIGKPIFVDHHNSNPAKARGVIRDSKFRVLDHRTSSDHYWKSADVDPEHLPASEVELLLEVDAKSFPRLAQAIVSGDLDGFSMGCDVDYSKCSHCGHIASSPEEYCSHVMMKGAHHDYKTADGKRVSRKSYENCYGIKFFEISAVFEPADETALAREVRSAVHKEADLGGDNFIDGAPSGIETPDPLRGSQNSWVRQLAEHYMNQEGLSESQALEKAQMEVGDDPLANFRNNRQPQHEGLEGDQLLQYRDYTPMPSEGLNSFQNLLHDHPHNNPIMSSVHKHAENPLPQEMHTRAPDEVDTLRKEQICPICGNDMQAETCSVCGYVQPPKEFDNPDLEKAKEIRQEMKDDEEASALGGGQQEQMQSVGPTQQGPAGEQTAQNPPTKPTATAMVKSDMHNWTPKVHPKTAARINQIERPVSASNQPVSNEPQKPTVLKDQTVPVTSSVSATPAMRTAQELMNRAKRESMHTRTADGPTPPGDTSPKTRTDVTGVGGVDEASNEQASKADAQVDVTGIGGTGVSDVAADKTESLPTAGESSDDSGFNKDKTTDDSGPTKTFGDSDGSASGVGDPVTKEPFPASEDGVKSSGRLAYEDGTLESLDQQGDPVAQGGTAVKGVQPVAEQFGDRVNLLEHKTTPANNSGPTTTWTGTDGNGVLKQQDPVTKEDQEWGGVKVPDVQLHTTGKVSIAALRLAEAEVELGLVAPKDKWNRMVEHDAKHPAVVAAELETLSRVKTAGLAKLTAHRQASRVPSFKRIANGAESVAAQPVDNESLDAGLFLR